MSPSRQRGAALLALLLVLSLGGAWYFISRLNAATANRTVEISNRNAAVLARAKQALMGYVAQQAAIAGEDNPGAFPCPETPSGMTSTTGFDGRTQTPNCTLPAVGRFPWRTIGTEQLVDASGEPLWYVVASGWSKPSAAGNTIINSNCTSDATMLCNTGMLTVDGVKDAVALIIAPGPAFNVPAATGCTAWNQVRTISASPDFRNYLECENATSPADATFVATGTSGSFNDQVVKVPVGEILPLIEGAIANRIEREIVPQLKAIYALNTWGTNVSAANPVYPYPAPFANPGTTASYQGNSTSCTGGVCKGLLPVIFTNTPGSNTTLCTPGGSSLCDPMFVKWASGTIEVQSVTVPGFGTYVPGLISTMLWSSTQNTCTVTTFGTPSSSQLDCDAAVPSLNGVVADNVLYEVRGVADRVGMSLRSFNPTASLAGVTTTSAPTVAMNNTGMATMTLRGTTTAPTTAPLISNLLCGLTGTLIPGVECRKVTVSIPLTPLFPDHQLLDSTNASTGWFMRNGWFRVMYYAVAQGDTAAALPAAPACTPSTNCLTVANVTPAASQRAILILAGRSINGKPRPDPAGTIADYLEFGNASGSFERRKVTFAASTVYADTGSANAYAVAATTIAADSTLQFRATNANTGASTLSTAATGARNLLNADGSGLTSGQIQGNAVIEVIYDGTKFVLSKRPFNDRVIVVDNN